MHRRRGGYRSEEKPQTQLVACQTLRLIRCSHFSSRASPAGSVRRKSGGVPRATLSRFHLTSGENACGQYSRTLTGRRRTADFGPIFVLPQTLVNDLTEQVFVCPCQVFDLEHDDMCVRLTGEDRGQYQRDGGAPSRSIAGAKSAPAGRAITPA